MYLTKLFDYVLHFTKWTVILFPHPTPSYRGGTVTFTEQAVYNQKINVRNLYTTQTGNTDSSSPPLWTEPLVQKWLWFWILQASAGIKYWRETSSWSKIKWTILLLTISVKRKNTNPIWSMANTLKWHPLQNATIRIQYFYHIRYRMQF